MIVRYVYKVYLAVAALILFGYETSFAQAPQISYPTPQNYTAGAPITPLVPANKGGDVPANTYGLVTTFAGNGKNGPANGQGPVEYFNYPIGVTIDKSGNLYVPGGAPAPPPPPNPGGAVTKIPLSFATAPAGFSPYGIVADNSGNLYAADPFANLVWKIDPAGNVTVFADRNSIAGTGAVFSSPSGIAIDNAGYLYVANTGNGSILKINAGGTATTIANGLNHPTGMVVDGQGNLYEVEQDGNQVNKISPAGTVSTIASGTAAGFQFPQFITVDPAGNLYVTDSGHNLIKKITPAGVVTTVAGNTAGGANGGVGTAAGFNAPRGIGMNSAGDVYIVDSGNNLVRKITLSGYTIDKPLPPGLSFDSSTGTISGTPTSPYPSTDYTISAYNTSGGSTTTNTIKVSNAAVVLQPPHITYTPASNVYTTNIPMQPLVPANDGGPVSPETNGVTTFAGSTGSSGTFAVINSIRSAGGGSLYVTDGSNRVLKITPGGLRTIVSGSGVAGYM